MYQEQYDRASTPDENSFNPFDAKDGFFPAFGADRLMRHKLCFEIIFH
jgi:hypothetical protein